MEIEAKFVLGGPQDFEKAIELFKAAEAPAVVLENYFFDGSRDELATAGIMCRLRIKGDASAELTLKAHTEVEDGSVCRFVDQSISLPVADARAAIQNPNALLPVLAAPQQQHGFSQLKYLGGFRTSRKTCSANIGEQPLNVKLDEVVFPFGQTWELEVTCRDVPVHDVNQEIHNLLSGKAIKHELGSQNKFQQFMAGCREAMIAPTSFAP